jgi:hypothetical protein
MLAVHEFGAVVFLPLAGVAMAFSAHCIFGTGKSRSVET